MRYLVINFKISKTAGFILHENGRSCVKEINLIFGDCMRYIPTPNQW